MPATTTTDRILSPADVCKMLGITRSSLSRWRAEGEFPKPIRIGPNRVGWRSSTISDWLDSRPEA